MVWGAVDYGNRRIGLAISDPGELIAFPGKVIAGSGNAFNDARKVHEWADRNEIAAIVVGMPFNMNGTTGPQATLTQRFVQQLAKLVDRPVETWDERLSSFQADQIMAEAGLTSAKRKRLRDALAAQVILQSFLDARRSSEEH